tara:strand:- start:41671 stop:41976 length:306 start_codon:yes stop_codon:yes gene_type:complete
MNFNDQTKFKIEETVAFVKDQAKDQYNIILLDSADEDDADKVFIAKGTSFHIWENIINEKTYAQLMDYMQNTFEPFGEVEKQQVDEFLTKVIQKGFVICQD